MISLCIILYFLQLLYSILYVVYIYSLVTVYNPCISQPCQHGGECINATEGFACKCKGNHNGTICSGRFYAVGVSVRYNFLRNPGARRCAVIYTNKIPTLIIHVIVVVNIILKQ